MTVETKKYAQYQDHTYRSLPPLEVYDEQDALEKATVNATRFVLFERTFIEHDGETLSGEPKNRTPFVYVNVDNILTRDDVIASFQKDLDKAKGDTLSDEFSRNISINVLQSLVNRFSEFDANTRFIRESGQSGNVIKLNEGEKVYNRAKTQIWPAPDAAPSNDVTPAP